VSDPQFGARLRALRKARGITLPALAVAAGISKGYLSKIEKSPSPPPFSTLQALTRALGADLTQLLSGEPPAGKSRNLEIHGPREGTWQQSGKLGGYSFLPLLQSYRNKYLAPFLMLIPPGPTLFFRHDGEEFIYVLSGKVDLEYEGKKHHLEEGASTYLDSRIRHRFHNETSTSARLLAVNFDYRRF
jgi:transcriptional regulator with XRE-family HTH domain